MPPYCLQLLPHILDTPTHDVYVTSIGTLKFPLGTPIEKVEALVFGTPFKRSYSVSTPDSTLHDAKRVPTNMPEKVTIHNKVVMYNISQTRTKPAANLAALVKRSHQPLCHTAPAVNDEPSTDGDSVDDDVDDNISIFETTRRYKLPPNSSKVTSADCTLTNAVVHYLDLVFDDRLTNCPASIESLIRTCKDTDILHDVFYRLKTKNSVIDRVIDRVAANSRIKPGRGSSREKVIKNIAEIHDVSVSKVYILLSHAIANFMFDHDIPDESADFDVVGTTIVHGVLNQKGMTIERTIVELDLACTPATFSLPKLK